MDAIYEDIKINELYTELNFDNLYNSVKISDLYFDLNFDLDFSPYEIEQMFINIYKDLKSTIYFHDNKDWKFIYTEFRKHGEIG
jgi:ankyrin repeat protein